MHLAHTVSELHGTLQPWRAARDTIALVPTMGNLHAGHVDLVKKARRHAECVVVSIFVNPLQFGPGEDYERYPRTLDEDRRLLAEAGVEVVFAPTVRDVYPGGYPPLTTVRVGGTLSGILCARFRPDHFTGVATVVNVLFNLVDPDLAVFGEKDYQQLAVIRRMVADLGLSIRVLGVPTAREDDGLARSSRNRYLSAPERALAPRLYEALQRAGEALRQGRRDFGAVEEEGSRRLSAAGFVPQYFEVRTPELEAPGAGAREFVVLAAAMLGSTRLIDNLTVHA